MKAKLLLVVVAIILYLTVSWMVFQWRNPKANEMSLYRDFGAVVRWQKLGVYQ